MIIDPSVARNMSNLEQMYVDNNYFHFQHFDSKQGKRLASVAYLSVIVNQQTLNKQFVRKINEDIQAQENPTAETILGSIRSLGIDTEINVMDMAAEMISDAGIVIFIEGLTVCYGIGIPGYETRAVDQPTTEINVRGPREGFTEDLKVNMGLVYRRMKTTKLKSKIFVLGRESQTKVMIVYLDDQVDASVLREVEERIESVKLNIVVDSAQIEEWIQDSPYSPFPQIMNTERPDRVVTALNLGKVIIFTDGSPNALIAPSTFTDFLHPSEDLYEKFYFANFLRLLRMLTLLISLCGPSLYIALTTFHLEMIPTPLMLTFLSTKAGIPFPTFLEALIMEVAFEILREASIRLPRTVGQSVSIVGALIIGEAAVQSGIISRPMVIVVAMTGIASFTIPSFNTAITLRLLRFPLIFIAAWTGVLGLALGMFAIVLHLCSLRSFGKLYLPMFNSHRWKDVTEHYVLLPIKHRRQSKNDTSYASMEGQVREHEDH
ncbi:spore germination protein [Paenibacillus lignilyticus]|uniref:Spore germination protein n=1 Tax=Paenibacillus lignilyticus TaxID=1172615 RepID=A0ABS5CDT2_9BACL|nr:spore germination protein [Paenibacillus lignilyticus]MBP3964101.1 spore germination protein [Paenibacillus lignilyticus]